MAKIAHVINDGGNVYTRRPWTVDMAATAKYNGEKFFMDHERSAFVERLLGDTPYIELTGRAVGQDEMQSVTNWMVRFARHGLRANGQQWKFLYGSWTDKGSMIMIPADSRIGNLDDLGLHIHDVAKAPKYMKRAKAPHQYSVFGDVLEVYKEDDGFIVEFKLEDGYIGQVRHVFLESLTPHQKAVADGQGRVNPKFLGHIGVKARDLNLYSCKGTTLDKVGLGKGYYHAQKDLEFDVVVYGPKTQLTYDKFFFGILGSLKPGSFAYTDLQSMANFDEWNFAPEAAQNLFLEITESLRDEEKLSGLFMSRVNESRAARIEQDEEDAPFTGWSIINAKRVGMSLHAEPSLVRKAAQHWTNEVINCGKGRIPADHLMRRCDIVPDPNMFNSYGDVVLENTIIPAGHMVCWDVPQGPTVEYRQPNGHALEHSASMNLHLQPLKKYEGMQRSFYGADMLEMNEPKNGADNDDTQVVVFNPQMVKMIRSLTYPLTQKMQIRDGGRKRTGQYFDKLKGKVENALHFSAYGPQDFENACVLARENTLHLGQVVNNIMLDTLLSGAHKANMMKYLDEFIQNPTISKETRIMYLDKREWLANRQDYQLRDVATNLEAVIDLLVQGKGSLEQFGNMISLVNEVKNNTKVYPFIYGKEGTGFLGQGRIAPTKQALADYIFAPSLMCDALNTVEEERTVFQNDLRAFEWECISDVPEELEFEFGHSEDIKRIALDIRRDFNQAVAEAMNISSSKLRRDAYRSCIYGKFHKCDLSCERNCKQAGKLLQKGLRQWMDELSNDDERMFVAVELKRIVHGNRTPRIDENTGAIRGVPDGVFGNDVVFNIYLQALEKVGLTGQYVPVDFDQISEKYRLDTFDVVVEQGNVLRKEDHFWLGTVDADNGEYRLVQGYVETRKPGWEIADPHRFDEVDENGNFINPIDLNM